MINWKLFLKINPVKSVLYSLRSNGIVLVGWGSKIFMGKDSKIVFSKNRTPLYIGVNFNYPVPTIVDIHDKGRMIVGKSVYLNRGCKIVVGKGAQLKIGSNSFLNENSRLHCRLSVSIGEKCAISWNVNILDTDEHGIYSNGNLLNENKPVKIGSNVWIGANSTILRNTQIEDNCIIGANSLVKGKLSGNTIYAGNPLQAIKEFEYWGKMRH
ncbi:acyltransferase [Gracilimonas mengyeensis]|uniref:Transferase hexapeptide (Six repeat-containing protein) n=1 Tax=Gracilimonas mengyeensis TaxID=1302730 RepID=A0A521FKN3_9BACT|nr:acyltransferase [Gracilimonas mengyeensis]SMO96767.1 transferase hexapeptide (six repeat-containing protein) [Gracilimonas mengyeensis]